MAWAPRTSPHYIKIEDSPEPDVLIVESTPLPVKPPVPVNPRDPENFLKRCSGLSKKTNLRCSAIIGKKSQKDNHPTFLPTCSSHRDQQSLAGWCQFKRSDGNRCGRLFRWRPPYFELCNDHRGHPGTPCYFLKQLPLELRREVYRYLLPTESIGSSTAAVHQENYRELYPMRMVAFRASHRPMPPPPPPLVPSGLPPLVAAFPMRLTNLLLVSRQIHDEVKDLLFSVVTFKIDVRKDGAFMCGRRLLEPKRADGSSHMMAEEADKAKKKFLKSFDWASVKNYTVDILLENWGDAYPHVNRAMNTPWDEEVEIYDIRDYVSVVVSGILAKSKKLCKLQVRLGLDDFQWDEEHILSNSKLLLSPFERLRNVRKPSIGGVFDGRPNNNSVYSVIPGTSQIYSASTGHYENCCSVPSLPTNKPILAAGMSDFDRYAAEWKRQISLESSSTITEEPPIRKMFAEFRNFYTELANYVPDVSFRSGRHTFLHRARVAREQENVIAFREIRNELIHYWEAYKADEERKKREINKRLGKLLESDMYPSHEWEEMSPARAQSPSGQTARSPVLLDSDRMAQEGIPMTGNSSETRPYTSEQYIRMMRSQQQQRFQAYAPLPQRHINNSSTGVPMGSHPTLSDFARQHQQILHAQQVAQSQAQQQAQQQQKQYRAQQRTLFQKSRQCLAELVQLRNRENTIRQRANQALSSARVAQQPVDAVALQQSFRKQAHVITLAVVEAQKRFHAIESETRVLEGFLTSTAAGMTTNTSVDAGVKKDADECAERKEKDASSEGSPDTIDNEDLYSDPFRGDSSAKRGDGANARSEMHSFTSKSTATDVDTTVQSGPCATGSKRKGADEMLPEGEGIGIPGPSSTKKQRVDSGYYEWMEYDVHSSDEWRRGSGDVGCVSQQSHQQQQEQGSGYEEASYVGKGKGKIVG